MAAVVGGFIPLLVSGAEITPGAGLNPFPVWITPLTATLIHGGYAHLLLNMVMFVYCGRMVERELGTRGLIILYVVGAYVSAGGPWLQAPHSPVPMVGASGAFRSEERRVGKECVRPCRFWWSPYPYKNKNNKNK